MDSRYWQRKGWFRPGLRFECQWSSDGKVVASVNVRTELGRVVLAYPQRGNDGGARALPQFWGNVFEDYCGVAFQCVCKQETE